MHRLPPLILTIALAGACTTADARSTQAQDSAPARATDPAVPPAPRPTATPAYAPGPHFTGGTVIAKSDRGVILRTVEHGDLTVDLRNVRSVWRETEVTAAALEIADELFVNGTWDADGLDALYLWANIGRLDGIVRAIDGEVLTLEVTVRAGMGLGTATRQVELSRSVTFVEPLTRADLVPGRVIGAVLYAPHTGLARLTRIW